MRTRNPVQVQEDEKKKDKEEDEEKPAQLWTAVGQSTFSTEQSAPLFTASSRFQHESGHISQLVPTFLLDLTIILL